MDKTEKLLQQANHRFKQSNAGIVIFKRGQKLSLRGMLPPKPGKQEASQQTVSLGIYCNPAGIKNAEKQAQKLASEIALKEFNWDSWRDRDRSIESVGYWIDKFEADYFNRKERNDRTLTTWDSEYAAMFKRLPGHEKLSKEILLSLVFDTQPDSRQRQRACMVAQALAKFAGLDLDLSSYKGSYDSTKAIRNIPSDQQITLERESIPNLQWQYIYGLIAAYGLSNHEIFYIDWESIAISPGHRGVNYRKGKQDTRTIWCLYPEWWKEWKLYDPIELPNLSGKNNKELGGKITKAFARYKVTQPYNLRHAWAIRAINFIPVELAARMMGHSVDVHCRTYQRWINESHQEQMYRLMMLRRDRPLPP